MSTRGFEIQPRFMTGLDDDDAASSNFEVRAWAALWHDDALFDDIYLFFGFDNTFSIAAMILMLHFVTAAMRALREESLFRHEFMRLWHIYISILIMLIYGFLGILWIRLIWILLYFDYILLYFRALRAFAKSKASRFLRFSRCPRYFGFSRRDVFASALRVFPRASSFSRHAFLPHGAISRILFIGIFINSLSFIAFFMRWLGAVAFIYA